MGSVLCVSCTGGLIEMSILNIATNGLWSVCEEMCVK